MPLRFELTDEDKAGMKAVSESTTPTVYNAEQAQELEQAALTNGGVGGIIGDEETECQFASQELFNIKYGKHAKEFGEISEQEYLQKANALANAELSDDVVSLTRSDGSVSKYRYSTNEFLVINEDNTIRTFFKPEKKEEYWQYEIDRN